MSGLGQKISVILIFGALLVNSHYLIAVVMGMLSITAAVIAMLFDKD